MDDKMPRTPFATPLSRSARETEIRIRNICSGPKRRPPVFFLALMFATALLCGNLVSCQVAEAEVPNAPANTSHLEELPEGWSLAELDTGMMEHIGQMGDWWYEDYYLPTPEEMALLADLPADELPREAVELSRALRRDYWRDALLPAAYDEAEDVTVYLVVSGMPDKEPGAGVPIWAPDQQRGIVLRHGDRAVYFHLCWDGNAKYGGPPLLLVDDFDSDGRPEAAVALCLGGGTGCYEEDLYLFDLDTMTYTIPDFSQVPLEIAYDPDKDLARMASGDQERLVRLDDLGLPFEGEVEVGNIVRFSVEDGQILCHLEPDFTCSTLGYVAYAEFPVIYEDGAYRLGPAVHMGDIL